MGKRTQRPKVIAEGFKSDAKKREELARIHARAPEPHVEPRPPAVRWIVPRAYGIPTAHAYVSGAFTMCRGFRADGGVYPAVPELGRCADCIAAVKAWELRTGGKDLDPLDGAGKIEVIRAPAVDAEESAVELTDTNTVEELEELEEEKGDATE